MLSRNVLCVNFPNIKVLRGMFIILYADDILLIAPSIRQLSDLLLLCESELSSLDMTINVKNLVVYVSDLEIKLCPHLLLVWCFVAIGGSFALPRHFYHLFPCLRFRWTTLKSFYRLGNAIF